MLVFKNFKIDAPASKETIVKVKETTYKGKPSWIAFTNKNTKIIPPCMERRVKPEVGQKVFVIRINGRVLVAPAA